MEITKTYKIGDFTFEITCPEDFIIPENFRKFEVFEGEPSYHYLVEYAQGVPLVEGEIVARRQDIAVFQTETGEARYIGVKGLPYPYALYIEESQTSAHVFYDHNLAKDLNIDPVFVSLFALEKRMAAFGAMILHCAYTDLDGRALLFSAPSETGKTTQANLWKKYRGVETVNGDRALIENDANGWYANGWPVCGTSEICNNKKLPIKAIVMLRQSKDGTDTIEKLGAFAAFRLLYSQITVNGWNAQVIDQAMALIERLVQEVPVYELTCTISEEAVKVLENALNE